MMVHMDDSRTLMFVEDDDTTYAPGGLIVQPLTDGALAENGKLKIAGLAGRGPLPTILIVKLAGRLFVPNN